MNKRINNLNILVRTYIIIVSIITLFLRDQLSDVINEIWSVFLVFGLILIFLKNWYIKNVNSD